MLAAVLASAGTAWTSAMAVDSTAVGQVQLAQAPIRLDAPGGANQGGQAGDEGVVCSTAVTAPAEDMPTVIKACSRIQGKQPTPADRARVLRYRGIAQQRSGNLSAAVADFDQVLATTPDDWRALKGRAEANKALGNRDRAFKDYAHLEQLMPDTRWRIEMAELGGEVPLSRLQAAEPPGKPAGKGTAEAAPTPKPQPLPTVAQPAPAAPPAEDPAVLVRKLQVALRDLGYDVGAVSGKIGAKSRQAFDSFAKDAGFESGGDPTPDLLAAATDELAHRRQLAAQEDQKRVRRAQQALADLGYYTGDVDGQIGPMSRRALDRWLAENGRPPGQPVTDDLVAALDSSVSKRPPPKVADASATKQPAFPEKPVALTPAPPKAAPPIVELTSPPGPYSPPEPPVTPSMPELAPAPPAAQVAVVNSGRPYDVLPPRSEAPEKRVALVIGNGRYGLVTPLTNPRNDAEDVAAVLSDIGFEVLKGIDLARADMTGITKDFARRARTADIALAYYSGHGMQFGGTNYLVPIDVQVQDEYDLADMVQLNQVIQYTGQAKKLALVIVDACRDDPLAVKALAQNLGSSRSTLLQGLAAPQLPPTPSLIAYATAANRVAFDGSAGARNSPFTAALLSDIKTPKLDVNRLFGKISDEVQKATGGAQRPDTWAALGGDPIYLVPGPPDPVGLGLTELTSSEVQLIQRSLKWLKYWSGSDDGHATAELTLAVRSWQRS